MNKYLEDWSKQLDEIEVELDMDGLEVADYFEKGKNELKEVVSDLKQKVEGFSVSDNMNDLRAKMEHLQVQLALGKAESKDAFEDQKGKIDKAITEMGTSLKAWEDSVEEKTDEMTSQARSKAESFQTKLDMMRLHYHLAQADARDALEEKRKSLRTQIHETKTKMAAAAEKEESRWDDVKDELSESFSHLKKAIKSIFD